ncbi:MAG: DUF805 domain-containing protein [Sulfitobacter sp.]|nr:DUF805 domain-containing protein [Sulfitobacter sp.]
MSPIEKAVRRVLSKYATFEGRAPRAEFWWWTLAMFILFAILRLIDGILLAPFLGFGAFSDNAGQPLSSLVSLALLLPCIAVAARRLHDTDRNGWWLLLVFVPLIGPLVLLYFYVQPSDGANRFGPPNPL